MDQAMRQYWLQRCERWLALVEHAARLQRPDLLETNLKGYDESLQQVLS